MSSSAVGGPCCTGSGQRRVGLAAAGRMPAWRGPGSVPRHRLLLPTGRALGRTPSGRQRRGLGSSPCSAHLTARMAQLLLILSLARQTIR